MATSAASQEEVFTLNLIKVSQNQDPYPVDYPPLGSRIPPHPIYCNISKDNGVEISTIDCEINSYEVWDIDGNYCIASFSEETEFVEFVFSMTSNFTIRIITDEFYLFGNVFYESF